MEDGVVGRGAAQLDDFGGHVHAAGRCHQLGHHVQAQLLRGRLAGLDGVAAEFGVGVDEGHLGARLFLGDVLEQDAEHLRVVGSHEELVRVLGRVVELGGEGGARHEDGAVAVQLGVDGLGKARGVAVVEVDLVLAGDLLERGHRDIDLVARVLGHVADLAALDAACLVDHLHVVAHAGIDAHAREGEHARHGDGAADHDVFAASLGAGGQRCGQAGAGRQQQAAAARGGRVLLHCLSPFACRARRRLNCGRATGGRSGAGAATFVRAPAARRPERR